MHPKRTLLQHSLPPSQIIRIAFFDTRTLQTLSYHTPASEGFSHIIARECSWEQRGLALRTQFFGHKTMT